MADHLKVFKESSEYGVFFPTVKAKQGKGISDHSIPLGDWFIIPVNGRNLAEKIFLRWEVLNKRLTLSE